MFLIACGQPADPAELPDAGCVADGANACFAWAWTFRDPGTQSTVACPPEVTSIRLVGEQREIVDSSYAVVPRGEVSAACADGRATLRVGRSANTLRLEAIAGDRVYAKVPIEVVNRDVIVDTDRGWAKVAWTFYSQQLARELTCAEAGERLDISDLRITSTDVTNSSIVQVDEVPCAGQVALTSGLVSSIYGVTFALHSTSGQPRSVVDLGVLEIDEGQVTDFGSAMLMIP